MCQGLVNRAGRSGTKTSVPATCLQLWSTIQTPPLGDWASPSSKVPRGIPPTMDDCYPGERAGPRRVLRNREGFSWWPSEGFCVGGDMLRPRTPQPFPLPPCTSRGDGFLLPSGGLIPSPDKRHLPSASWGPDIDSESCEHEHFSIRHSGLLFIYSLSVR